MTAATISDTFRQFISQHADEVVRHAVKFAREELPLADGESAVRVERECRLVFQRLLPDERKPDGEGRLRLSLPAYLRAGVAVGEGLARTLEASGGDGLEGARIEREAARLLGARLVRAALIEQERRDRESGRDQGQIEELEGTKGKLERTIDHLTKLFESSPDGILTLDEEGKILTLNKAARAMAGYRSPEIVGEPFATLLGDAKVARNLFKRLRKRVVSNYETRLRHKDGSEIPISVSASVFERGEGETTQMLLMLRDLSEVEEMKAQLIEKEQMAAMAKVAGLVAHEIRNPLNSLFLNTDLLEDEMNRDSSPISARATHLLSVVREEIDRLNSIIVNYLSLSKVSSLSPQPTDVNEFLGAVVAEKRGDCEESRVEIVEELAPALPNLFIDVNQMRRVLFNLIENALNAMPDGGKLVFRTAAVDGDHVSMAIRDSGIGIAAEHMQSVFNPFFSRLGGGTGLGLYLSREIVEAHEGRVGLASEAGIGTTVTITLPVLDEWEGA